VNAGGVAPILSGVLHDLFPARLIALHASAGAADEAITHPGNASQRGVGPASDPDRDLTVNRKWAYGTNIVVVELSLALERLATPGLAQQANDLLRPSATMLELNVRHLEVVLAAAHAQSKDRPAA
jgi:hypothetical protein